MNLQDYLKREKMTVTSVAKKLGISRTYLDFIVHGKRRPARELAQAIVDFSDGEVTLEDVLPERQFHFCPLCKKPITKNNYKEIMSLSIKPFTVTNAKERFKS